MKQKAHLLFTGLLLAIVAVLGFKHSKTLREQRKFWAQVSVDGRVILSTSRANAFASIRDNDTVYMPPGRYVIDTKVQVPKEPDALLWPSCVECSRAIDRGVRIGFYGLGFNGPIKPICVPYNEQSFIWSYHP